MLALLHDHDVGSFGTRDLRVVCRLRHARNRIRPWDDQVKFTGYWESGDWVRAESDAARVSFYHRPDELLLMVGNTGKTKLSTTVKPNWEKLSLDPVELGVYEAETGLRLRLTDQAGIPLTIPSHELGLVYVGRQGRFEGERVTSEGLTPPNVLKEHSDFLTSPSLAPVWEKSLHKGPYASVTMVDGRLMVAADSYGYGHVRRELGVDNVSVQCLILQPSHGGMDQFSPSLILWWETGELWFASTGFVQAAPGMVDGKFYYATSTDRKRRGSEVNRTPAPNWYPHMANWVKIALLPKKVVFYASADGKTWKKDWEVPRGESLSGPPKWLILGNGSDGEEPLFCNPHPQHHHRDRARHTFFSDVIVAKLPGAHGGEE